MPFPQGGDFPRSVQRTFKVLKSDRRICIHDNGTTVCNLGYKLKFPGTCFNQAIGTFNSTDPTFQPTFPICTVDYESSGFHPGIVFTKEPAEGSGTVFGSSGGAEKDHPVYGISPVYEQDLFIHKLLKTVEGYILAVGLSNSVSGSTFFKESSSSHSSYFLMAQFRPGVLPHLPGTTSELYDYDVFSSTFSYNRLVVHFIETLAATLRQTGDVSGFMNLVDTDYYTTISGEVDICKGDETPPFITYIDPTASGTVLRPTNQVVDFLLSDAVAGVELSSIKITLSSQTTGNITLVSAGVDQTGGRVSITGDQSSYRIRYVPNFTWNYNDTVITTISGTDKVPMVGGNPFFCDAGGVNTFYGDIRFQVLNYQDFGASITPVGDTSPPYIVSTSPVSGTLDNSVFTPVNIVLADQFAGIDISSLEIVVDGVAIVSNGLPSSSETVITGTPAQYAIDYNKSSAFDYDSTIQVSVYTADRAVPTPNVLSTSYTFSCITDGTMRIENFVPAIGTTVNPHDIDIEVDIFDDLYGVDEDQSFLVVNSSIVPATITTITSGIHLSYHPPNDFSYSEPVVVKVHGVNNNTIAPVVRENIYTIFYGYRLLLHHGGPYDHEETIDVFVRARNIEQLHKDLSTGYFFTAYTQPRSNLGASIEAVNPVSNLGASIVAQGPQHRYGETVTVTFYVEDYDGHAFGPYTFSYTIEEAPE